MSLMRKNMKVKILIQVKKSFMKVLLNLMIKFKVEEITFSEFEESLNYLDSDDDFYYSDSD